MERRSAAEYMLNRHWSIRLLYSRDKIKLFYVYRQVFGLFIFFFLLSAYFPLCLVSIVYFLFSEYLNKCKAGAFTRCNTQDLLYPNEYNVCHKRLRKRKGSRMYNVAAQFFGMRFSCLVEY